MKISFFKLNIITVFIIGCLLLFVRQTYAETIFGPNVRVDDTGESSIWQSTPDIAVDTNGNIYVV